MKKDVNFHPSSPILRVNNLAMAIDYYMNKLGFSVDWVHDKVIASVSRERANIMLCQGDQGNGKAWIYVGIGDTEQLYEEYKFSGATIRQEPTNFAWAFEMQVEDIDGNVIRFGSEPQKDMPYGLWLDMHGNICK